MFFLFLFFGRYNTLNEIENNNNNKKEIHFNTKEITIIISFSYICYNNNEYCPSVLLLLEWSF